MAASVPEERIDCVQDEVAISNAVRAVHWTDAARLQCWAAGRGSMDVPAHAPLVSIAANSTHAFRYWTKPRYQTTRYAFSVVLTASAPQLANVAIPSGGSLVTVRVTERRNATPVTLYADRSSQSDAEAELSLDINAPAGGGTVKVECIAIEALPRAVLSTSGSDLGANRLAFWPRQPIAENTLTNQILDRQNDLRDSCRRVGEFQFSRGTTNPWIFNSGSFVALFDDGVAMLGRRVYSADVARTVSWRVLARCGDGTTAGEIRVNTTSGGTGVSTITIPAGTTDWTWLPSTGGAAATFDVDAEDNAEPDGRRGPADDDATFEARRTAGTKDVEIASVSVFDAAA